MKPSADHAIVAALLLLVASLWMPPLRLQRPVYDYMVTFDITQSMDVEDVALTGRPVSRLALARAAMRETLRRLHCGSRIGWSVFADYRAVPLMLPVEVCGHYEELLASLDAIDGRMRWANASNIGRGLGWVLRSSKQIQERVDIVFITDGQEAPPLRGAELPSMSGITPGEIRGWVIGVGGLLPARIPRTDAEGKAVGYWEAGDVAQRFDGTGHEELSELREPHLQVLARAMGLGYRRLADEHALADAMLDARFGREAPVEVDARWMPALMALVLLAWRFRPALSRPCASASSGPARGSRG